ncbi:MAG: cytochrome c family protein [Coriobacteriia bacterium]|nr:cytochrome c family protein [Coriobacteriia bacterium]
MRARTHARRGNPRSRQRAAGATLLLALAMAFLGPPAASALQKVSASRFAPSGSCDCHSELLGAWQGSMHAQALSDPIYLAKLGEANKATDGRLGPFCEACHGPVAAMADMTGKDGKKRNAQAREGVGCDFCHQVTGTRKPVANSSWVVKPDDAKRAALKDAVSPAHRTAYSAFHRSAEFCGTCHDVNHPENGLALEATYTEWKESPYAERGVVCQDCHMTPGPGVTRPNAGHVASFGVERDHVRTMTFVGANAALGPKGLAEERLRAAAELTLAADDVVRPGSLLSVGVTLSNVGAGHYLPTGVTGLRRMWLEVVAEDARGREVLRGTRVFGTEFADARGVRPVEMWEAASIASDDRVPPGGFRTQDYEAPMPGAPPVTVTARLYYRGVPEELADKAGVEVPVTRMAEASLVVYGSEEQRAASSGGRARRRERAAWTLPMVTLLGVLTMLTAIGLAFSVAGRRGDDGG